MRAKIIDLPRPDRFDYDKKTGKFYETTPFGTIEVDDSDINYFKDEIHKANFFNDKKFTNELIFEMTTFRIITPSYFIIIYDGYHDCLLKNI
ncbi:MAG: hypothetical protein Satyrvirus27_15 [Satyrvirus sp.]|uniref:Uncharacterized protein n=1 Tax=Satyrvirus sp. TaxID=2487771 RepID=A0A3G5AES6_9VIRU|nr:MAG: hypothetical protein Satyrvirus27_15 [Satyrvirus sp.]